MKTLVLYATKYGAAREIAQRISKKINGSVVHDLKQGNIPSLDQFDCVIIGSSLYVGAIRKEAKAFLAQNADKLKQKKLGLFLSGFQEEGAKTAFTSNFPAEILQGAKATSFLGGIFDPKKAGLIERTVMKAAAKLTEYSDTIDNAQIEKFAEVMKS